MRTSLLAVSILSTALSASSGCLSMGSGLELSAVQGARRGLEEYEKYPLRREEPRVEKPSTGSVLVGELLAIFPGFFVHGLGHYYAGDYKTARKLSNIGQLGYVATAVGGGLIVGGYFLDREDQQGLAYGLYGTGGVVGFVGVAYFLTAWVYDMVDTPRAVRSGGDPPPRTPFIESMDIFE